MTAQIRLLTMSILVGSLLGCSSPAVSRDGSPGSIWFGGQTLGDICVVVHHKVDSGFQQIGFGTTDQTGFFHLVRTGGQDPLTLEPGDYCLTLESLGPQIVFPEIYLTPETTPLKATWTSDMTSLDLKAPEELLANLPK